MFLNELDHVLHFLRTQKRALHARRHSHGVRLVQHIAVAEQFFRTRGIENGTGVDLLHDLERHTRGKVGFDDTRNDVDGRTLRREHQMDTRRARFLRQALDAVLDILFGDHHQIGKFVDDEHDLRQPLFLGKKARIIFVDLADERSLSGLFFKERITALHFGDRQLRTVITLAGS